MQLYKSKDENILGMVDIYLKKQSDMIAKNQTERADGGYKIKENIEKDNNFDDGPNFV